MRGGFLFVRSAPGFAPVGAGRVRPGGVPWAGVCGKVQGRACPAPTCMVIILRWRWRERPRRGQDPSLRAVVNGRFVGRGLDHSRDVGGTMNVRGSSGTSTPTVGADSISARGVCGGAGRPIHSFTANKFAKCRAMRYNILICESAAILREGGRLWNSRNNSL